MKAKAKEAYEYSNKLLEDILINSKKNALNNQEKKKIIYETFEKISKEIVKERKEEYINYEKVLLNLKDKIKDLNLFFNIKH